MLADPDIIVEEVAARLKVAPSTLYRHLPEGRGSLSEDGIISTGRISSL